MPDRDVLHSDINCCYAQIECQARPELRGKPVVVGGDEEARHGIVLAKNLIAKRAGVKTAMALWEARKACPGLVVVPPARLAAFKGVFRRRRPFFSCTIPMWCKRHLLAIERTGEENGQVQRDPQASRHGGQHPQHRFLVPMFHRHRQGRHRPSEGGWDRMAPA